MPFFQYRKAEREDRHYSKLNLSFTLLHISLENYLVWSHHKPSSNTKYLMIIFLWVIVSTNAWSDEYLLSCPLWSLVFITELIEKLYVFTLFQNALLIQNYFQRINEIEHGFAFMRNNIVRKQNVLLRMEKSSIWYVLCFQYLFFQHS